MRGASKSPQLGKGSCSLIVLTIMSLILPELIQAQMVSAHRMELSTDGEVTLEVDISSTDSLYARYDLYVVYEDEWRPLYTVDKERDKEELPLKGNNQMKWSATIIPPLQNIPLFVIGVKLTLREPYLPDNDLEWIYHLRPKEVDGKRWSDRIEVQLISEPDREKLQEM